MEHLSNKDIEEIENSLNLSLPNDVRDRFMASNGFRGPTDCQFLYTYNINDNTDIVKINELIKSEDWFPEKFKQIILVGDDGCGSFIGYDTVNKQAIFWHPEDGTDIQKTKNTVTKMWAYVEGLYERQA